MTMMMLTRLSSSLSRGLLQLCSSSSSAAAGSQHRLLCTAAEVGNHNELEATTTGGEVAQPPKQDRLFEKIRLEMHGHENAVLSSYTMFIRNVCKMLDLRQTVPRLDPSTFRPYHRYILCVNRAKFAKKKYKLHYELRTYSRCMEVHHLTGSTASTFLEYIQRNIPEGVAMQVIHTELCDLPDTIPEADNVDEDQAVHRN